MIKLFLFFTLCVLCCACHYGTGVRKEIQTPDEFLNDSKINRESYIDDSIKLLRQFEVALKSHKDFFRSKEYFDSTKLTIDTILYNSNFDRLAILILSRNPTYRQLEPNKSHRFYYDATCYLGLRQRDALLLAWIGPNFSNSDDPINLSKMLREACFNEFAKRDSSIYEYNLNDKRFWESAIWRRNFGDTLR